MRFRPKFLIATALTVASTAIVAIAAPRLINLNPYLGWALIATPITLGVGTLIWAERKMGDAIDLQKVCTQHGYPVPLSKLLDVGAIAQSDLRDLLDLATAEDFDCDQVVYLLENHNDQHGD